MRARLEYFPRDFFYVNPQERERLYVCVCVCVYTRVCKCGEGLSGIRMSHISRYADARHFSWSAGARVWLFFLSLSLTPRIFVRSFCHSEKLLD